MSKSIYSKDYQYLLIKLKEARKLSGLKQIDVAKKIGKHQSYISKTESGERRLDVTELKKLADIYKKDISFFLR